MATTGSNAALHRTSQSPHGMSQANILKTMSMAQLNPKISKIGGDNQGSQLFNVRASYNAETTASMLSPSKAALHESTTSPNLMQR